MGILSIDLNNINLDKNSDEDDLDTIILIGILAWHIKFEKRKKLKKNISEEFLKNIREELIAIAKFGSYWDCGIGDIMFYTLSRDLPRRRNYIVLSHFG